MARTGKTHPGRLAVTLAALLALLPAAPMLAAEPCDEYRYGFAEIPPSPAMDSFLLRVESPERPDSFVLGTFHSSAAAVLNRWSRVALTLAEPTLRLYVTERDLNDTGEPALRELPEGRTLADRLADAPGLYPRVIDTLRRYRLPVAAAERWQPWFIAALLNQAPALSAPGERILDVRLLEQARASGLDSRFLESFASIAAGYGRFEPDQQQRLLWEAVCNQDTLATLVAEQTAAYAANDVARLHAALHRYTGSDPALADHLGEVFVVERNAAFWRVLEPEFQRGGLFVALGALHVFGDGGLLEQLAAAGLRVTALEPDTLEAALPASVTERLMAWTVDWLTPRGLESIDSADFADLRIDFESLPALRRRLCPGRRCLVESTYLPEEQRILLETGQYARLLASRRAQPDAESLLLRELVRHALYRRNGAQLRERLADHPRAADCLRSAVLHQASLARNAWLREQGVAPATRPFVRDARCPALF